MYKLCIKEGRSSAREERIREKRVDEEQRGEGQVVPGCEDRGWPRPERRGTEPAYF